ncbi:hypothetical protein [Klebsiella aerogenes]|uniref:Uncharacterized protein n=1 Tax=Klebsiella aerogenes TaxID=548 RepID=A0AAP9R0F0_KLEAE|nr:hypothetical protein [Klebsiella aerogenes]QMR41529.1 hypothetical protein HV331_19400 [Klebsiella aerogenes]
MTLSRISLPAIVLMLCACATEIPVSAASVSTSRSQPSGVLQPESEVVHTARYTLVSLSPDDALRQPLHQIIRHTLPRHKKSAGLTRGDGLRAWLAGTGYGLCLPASRDARLLYSSPLPDIWRSAGPMRIDTALQAIAGSAWRMTVEEVSRTVCFVPADQRQN